eukprot:s5052_g6.t1
MDTIPAIEDTSPVQLPLPAGEHGEGIRMSIRDQLESARMAQQMYHQSEIQKFEGVIQTLVSEMKEMQQEDEGSEIRIQELERQRDTACLAMQHMNNVNQEVKNDFELAVARINEHSQAQRHQDYIVTKELLQRLHQERNETAQNLAHIEERSQGDGVVMAKEYEMMMCELHAQARESLRLRANAASSEHALMALREHLQLIKSEEIVAAGEVVSLRTEGLRQHQHLHDRIGVGLQEQQHLRNRLDEEEEFRSMAMQRMQMAEDQLWQVENNAKHTLPTLHGELNELRRALKLQEDVQARTLSELEAARNAHQSFRQPSYVRLVTGVFNFVGSSQHTAQLVTEGAAPEHLVPRADSQAPERFAQRATLDEQAPVRFVQRATSSSSSPEKSVTTTSEDARAVRDRQLRDLLLTVRMRERVISSSSSTAVKGVSYDGDPSSEHVTAPTVDPAHAARVSVLEQQIEEMRNEILMQKAQKAEQRLRVDRDEWRLMAENLQTPAYADADDEEEDEGDRNDEDFHDAHDGGLDPEPDDENPGESPSRRGRRGPGPDPTDGEDLDGGDDPEYTDVKISCREADKVVVPPFPTVTHLDSWMSQFLANVLSACADPNQEEWMKWLSPAFRPHPDIEALNDSGHFFKSP